MDLYQKTQQGNRVRYIPLDTPSLTAHEIESGQMVNMTTTIMMCYLMTMASLMPQHSKLSREIERLEGAIKRFSELNCKPLDDETVAVGVGGWMAMVDFLKGVSKVVS